MALGTTPYYHEIIYGDVYENSLNSLNRTTILKNSITKLFAFRIWNHFRNHLYLVGKEEENIPK